MQEFKEITLNHALAKNVMLYGQELHDRQSEAPNLRLKWNFGIVREEDPQWNRVEKVFIMYGGRRVSWLVVGPIVR